MKSSICFLVGLVLGAVLVIYISKPKVSDASDHSKILDIGLSEAGNQHLSTVAGSGEDETGSSHVPSELDMEHDFAGSTDELITTARNQLVYKRNGLHTLKGIYLLDQLAKKSPSDAMHVLNEMGDYTAFFRSLVEERWFEQDIDGYIEYCKLHMTDCTLEQLLAIPGIENATLYPRLVQELGDSFDSVRRAKEFRSLPLEAKLQEIHTLTPERRIGMFNELILSVPLDNLDTVLSAFLNSETTKPRQDLVTRVITFRFSESPEGALEIARRYAPDDETVTLKVMEVFARSLHPEALEKLQTWGYNTGDFGLLGRHIGVVARNNLDRALELADTLPDVQRDRAYQNLASSYVSKRPDQALEHFRSLGAGDQGAIAGFAHTLVRNHPKRAEQLLKENLTEAVRVALVVKMAEKMIGRDKAQAIRFLESHGYAEIAQEWSGN